MFVIKYAVIALHMALVFALDRFYPYGGSAIPFVFTPRRLANELFICVCRPSDYTSPSDSDNPLHTLNRRRMCVANSSRSVMAVVFSYIHLNRACGSRHEAWVLPLEVIFSLFYTALCACSIACIKYNRNKPWRIYLSICESIVVVALFLDSVMAITKSNVLRSGVQVRFGVPLRPVLVILWSSRVREIISEVVQSCRSLKYMAILIVSWLVISSLFFVQSLRFECGLGDANRPHLFPEDRAEACSVLMLHFDNSLVGLVSGFILSTGEMYTVITLPLFDMPEHALDFAVVVSWTIITYFILMAIVLAIIFNAYKEAKRATLVKQSDTLDGCLFDAFKIIANPQNDIIGYDVYAKFLGYFQVACPLPCLLPPLTVVQPGINSKTVKLYWNNHSKVKVVVACFLLCGNSTFLHLHILLGCSLLS
jgi:energy-coupling factor transporter transmembrane protein EcfT